MNNKPPEYKDLDLCVIVLCAAWEPRCTVKYQQSVALSLGPPYLYNIGPQSCGICESLPDHVTSTIAALKSETIYDLSRFIAKPGPPPTPCGHDNFINTAKRCIFQPAGALLIRSTGPVLVLQGSHILELCRFHLDGVLIKVF